MITCRGICISFQLATIPGQKTPPKSAVAKWHGVSPTRIASLLAQVKRDFDRRSCRDVYTFYAGIWRKLQMPARRPFR